MQLITVLYIYIHLWRNRSGKIWGLFSYDPLLFESAPTHGDSRTLELVLSFIWGPSQPIRVKLRQQLHVIKRTQRLSSSGAVSLRV